jgi:hypothetical protein
MNDSLCHIIIKLFSHILDERSLAVFLKREIISKLVMYKSWNNEKFRSLIICLVNFLQKSSKFKQIGYRFNEYNVLMSLCDHECIRPDVQNELKILFNKYN